MSTTYRTKSTPVEALQVNWKNWYDLGRFIPGVINDQNPVRRVDTFADACGEDGPYIEFEILGIGKVFHGDWLVRQPDEGLIHHSPEGFSENYESIPAAEKTFDELENAAARGVLEGLPYGTHGASHYLDLMKAIQIRREMANFSHRNSLSALVQEHTYPAVTSVEELIRRAGGGTVPLDGVKG